MHVVRTATELSQVQVMIPGPVHFVPTMGALHAGHASLISTAVKNRDADRDQGSVLVSIFVNKTQFNDKKDFETYPRNEAADLKLCEMAGADIVFIPDDDQMYPDEYLGTEVCVPGISKEWEGRFRPGHFNGVATVVMKLFHLSLPDYAYFGEKDWQQCRVIERMVADLNVPVYLVFCPTVREQDGLAISSRNQLLPADERPKAPMLFARISQCADDIRKGTDPRAAELEAADRLHADGFTSVDYVAAVDGSSLAPIEGAKPGARVLAAASIGGVRLIDNVPI